MADLTIVAARVALVRGDDEHQETAPASAAIDAGSLCYIDTNGKWAEADADTAAQVNGHWGIAINTATTANEAITCAMKDSLLDLGDALDALAFNAPVYASNVAGNIGDAAGTTSQIVGRVVPGWGSTTPDKLLQIL
jgi:hypothetical protein